MPRNNDPPMSVEQLVRLEDQPGSGRIPAELMEMARDQLTVYSEKGERPKLEIEPVAGHEGGRAWRIALGDGVTPGLLGEELELGPAKELDVLDDEEEIDAVRPEWATLAYRPRVAAPITKRFLRRRNGRLVQPHYVIGSDDRDVYYPASWPWFLVGRVFVWRGGVFLGSGTGALVGRNVVLTASHMVPWGSSALGLSWKMQFIPGYYDGQSTLGAGVSSYVQKARGFSDHAQGDDMAVLKLYQPLGDSLGYFGYKTYNDDWEDEPYWTLAGYPGAVAGAERPSCQSGIAIIDDDSEGDALELEHTGDATDGNSGGPLWAWWGDSPRVIGTHSGSEYNWDEDNNVAAGGPPLSKLIKYARNNW